MCRSSTCTSLLVSHTCKDGNDLKLEREAVCRSSACTSLLVSHTWRGMTGTYRNWNGKPCVDPAPVPAFLSPTPARMGMTGTYRNWNGKLCVDPAPAPAFLEREAVCRSSACTSLLVSNTCKEGNDRNI